MNVRRQRERLTAAEGDSDGASRAPVSSAGLLSAPTARPAIENRPLAGQPESAPANTAAGREMPPPESAGAPPASVANDAVEDNAQAKPAARASSKGHRITRPALDWLAGLHRESFVQMGNMRLAGHVAAGQALERLRVRDGVVDLKPQTPIERYINERLARLDPEVVRRRIEWDEAKRTGDPDAMTRTANALIRAETEARAHLGPDQSGQTASRENGRDPISEILNPSSIADWAARKTDGERGGAADQTVESDADVGPGQRAVALEGRTQAVATPSIEVVGQDEVAPSDDVASEVTPSAQKSVGAGASLEIPGLDSPEKLSSGSSGTIQSVSRLGTEGASGLLKQVEQGEAISGARSRLPRQWNERESTDQAKDDGGTPSGGVSVSSYRGAERPRLLPDTHPGTICRNRDCAPARHSLQIDDQLTPEIRRVEAEAIAREYGPFTTAESLKHRSGYHQYYLETRISAPGKTCAQVIRQTQIRAVPQAFYGKGPWRDRPPRTDDWTWVWAYPWPDAWVPLPGGYVYHYVDRRTGAIVNMTTALHPLNPGYIVRWVTCERDGSFIIHTLGRGNGNFGAINEYVGPNMFSDLDSSVAEDLGGGVLPPSADDAY